MRIPRFLCRTLLVLAFMGFADSLSAQVGESRSVLAIGVNGGVGLNKVSFEPTIKQKFHTAPLMGITLRYTCEKYFKALCALQIELNYARLGWTELISDSQSEPLPDRYSRHLDYIQFPLLARIAFGREEKGMMGYLLAGPQLGYLVREEAERSAEWTLDANDNPDRPGGLFAQYDMEVKNKFDYGITAGLGAELNTRAGHFMIDARYYFALRDLFGNSKRDVFARSANGTILVKFTYLWDVLGRKSGKKQ